MVLLGNRGMLILITGLMLVGFSCRGQNRTNGQENRIKPYKNNPAYWQYKGQPVMLLGANATDSPYLLPDQETYYDELSDLGGNFTRYNVKQRLVDGLVQMFPHQKLPSGQFDLEMWNEDYWDLFEQGLEMTRDRGIFVQVELWDRFDVGCDKYYKNAAWCPANTVSYTEESSGLPNEWTGCDSVIHAHPFFHTVPELESNQMVLDLQKEFVDKVLSITLKFDHVLYVITNESTLPLEWSDYWARYISEKAGEKNRRVEVSEMPWTIADAFPFPWQQPSLKDPHIWIDHVLDHPGTYSFCAFQFQPIFKSRQEHYDRLLAIRELVLKGNTGVRPINAVKIFARTRIIQGEDEPNPQTRYWRPLLAGWSAVSLHRQHENSGYLGFSEEGQNNLSAARKFCEAIIPWNCNPAQGLLLNRDPDEAYLLANPGLSYGIYFPFSGSVVLNLDDYSGSIFSLRWINIETGDFYGDAERIAASATVLLSTPESGGNAGWAATLVVKR
jgi:hypothetical protein